MKRIWLYYPTSREAFISDRLHQILSIYKIWWPPKTTVKVGSKVICMEDIDLWPPEGQMPALEIAYQLNRGRKYPELNEQWIKRGKI